MERAKDHGLEHDTAQAWRRFQALLADHLAAMDEDDLLLVEAESPVEEEEPGAAPYVQVCAWGDHMLRGEVVSNTYLAQAHRLDARAEQALVDLGFARPSREGSASSNFYVDVAHREADRLAVMSVRALRDVFGVPHPAFLQSAQLPAEEPDESSAGRYDESSAERYSVAEPADEDVAAYPNGQEQLQEMVDAALTPFFGHPPVKDDDGDIPVVAGTSVVFVRVLADLPVVEMFAHVVDDIEDLDRAAFEVGVLNRDSRFVKYVLRDRMVEARLSLPAWPFAPEHLRRLLATMCEAVDEADDDLAIRLRAKRFLEPEASPSAAAEEFRHNHGGNSDQAADDEGNTSFTELLGEENQPSLFDHLADDSDDAVEAPVAPVRLPPALQALRELDAESPGSVPAELAASICEYDKDLILRLIRWAGEQEVHQRSFRDEATADDEQEASLPDPERDPSERTVRLLRQALRVTVERQLASENSESRSRVSRGPSASAAPRRHRRTS